MSLQAPPWRIFGIISNKLFNITARGFTGLNMGLLTHGLPFSLGFNMFSQYEIDELTNHYSINYWILQAMLKAFKFQNFNTTCR